MNRTTFLIGKMDCSSEEQMVRMSLQGKPNIHTLDFDLGKRQLHVYHSGNHVTINEILQSLNLDTSFIETHQTTLTTSSDKNERSLLWTVLAINGSFFAIELLTGIIGHSMGLIADSLDMFADAIVYGLALFAVGGSIVRKSRIAKMAGYFQVLLAFVGIIEVIRRFLGLESLPDFRLMIIISALALIANVVCLYLLQKGKSDEAHMKASMIFTSNDIIINAGVIVAGFLVHWTDSRYPDLVIGSIVFLIVIRGASRILKLSKVMKQSPIHSILE